MPTLLRDVGMAQTSNEHATRQLNVKLKHEPTLEQWKMIPEYLEGYVINTVWAREV
ncbi:MAG: hypothetical protein R3C18_22570 [Planctomycetaceae bacterium]